MASQQLAVASTLSGLFHFAYCSIETRQHAPAITLPKAFGKGIERLPKLYLQSLQPRS